jgi:hypothetical protein
VDLAQQVPGLGIGFMPVDNSPLILDFIAEEDVLGDVHEFHQGKFLIDNRDAGSLAFLDAVEGLELTIYQDLALIRSGRIHSGENLHKGGLPRSVFSDQGVYFTLFDPEVYVVQCPDTRELLDDILHF